MFGRVDWIGGVGPAWDPAAPFTLDFGVVVAEADGARLFFHRGEAGEHWERFRTGQRVAFRIDDVRGEAMAADLVPAADPRTLLRRMATSAFWSASGGAWSEEELRNLAAWAIGNLPRGARLSQIVSAMPRNLLLRLDESLLEKALPAQELAVHRGMQVVLLSDDQLGGAARRAFVQALQATALSEREAVWRRLEEHLTPDSPLWAMAPDGTKSAVLERSYGAFLSIVRGVRDVQAPISTADPSSAISLLHERDVEVAEAWVDRSVRGERREYERAKMLSARLAERVAADVYRRLGHDVEDVAIRQLDGDPYETRWRSCDLIVDGTWIDVKNARNTTNQRAGYVEHAVPRFKQDRDARDVVIAALLSPYLKLDQLRGESDVWPNTIDVMYLGETRRHELDELERRFSRPDFDVKIADRRGGALTYVPPWVFDLPSGAYAWREKVARDLRDVPAEGIPTWAVVEERKLPSVGLFLASGLPVPSSWWHELPSWARSLVRRTRDDDQRPVRLGAVYLGLLTTFVEQLRQGDSGSFDPLEAYRLVALRHGDLVHDHPAGCYDPLHMVRGLSNALGALWLHRERADLRGYRQFRYVGRGLLQGRRMADSDPWDTILAYCGGWIEGRGKCGASPLIVGIHGTCAVCRKLICGACLHCSDDCEAMEGRRKAAADDGGRATRRPRMGSPRSVEPARTPREE